MLIDVLQIPKLEWLLQFNMTQKHETKVKCFLYHDPFFVNLSNLWSDQVIKIFMLKGSIS
jgi:hypothetical protein